MHRWMEEDLKALEDPANWDWEHTDHHSGGEQTVTLFTVPFDPADFQRLGAAAGRAGIPIWQLIRDAGLQAIVPTAQRMWPGWPGRPLVLSGEWLVYIAASSQLCGDERA